MSTRIRHATVMLPEGPADVDVLVADGRIAAIDPAASSTADHEVDARGMTLMPGVIDDQVHFRDPGMPWKEDLHTGSRAAAAGGVTTFLEMPNTNPTTTSQARLEEKLALGRAKSVVNYGFYIGATPENIEELRHAHRTPGIKIFIGSSTGDLLVDEQAALERIFAEATLPITAHCEDEATIRRNRERIGESDDVRDHSRLRDVEAAVVATRRAVALAEAHTHPFHVLHVSTAAELEILRAAPPWVTSEVCLHHLFFHVGDYARLGTRIQMNPSVKERSDNEALWGALLDGTIDLVATDHAPHTLEEKARPWPASPSGLPAVENSLALMLHEVNRGRFSLAQVVTWMCERPAQVWGIRNKGYIREGFDADLVLVDLGRERTIRDEEQVTKTKWSPWHGETLRGWPVRTWVMGREVWRDGVFDPSVRGEETLFTPRRRGDLSSPFA
ncbi:MAG: dihydroorotase [Deltaproteobacteria bacterium]|nr:MAG: dihydroorotase [Deltaproteobacteria bacterium]